MDVFNIAVATVTAVAAVIGVTVALFQLRAGQRDARAARIADLSWQIYLAYESPEIRQARGAIARVARVKPVPTTAEEYGASYVLGEENLTSAVRRILRFYHQVGILLNKRLVDPEFVFPLIGAGLETAEPGIRVAVAWYQAYWAGEKGHDRGSGRLDVYSNATKLCDEYRMWRQSQP